MALTKLVSAICVFVVIITKTFSASFNGQP